ncbi:MAG: hypothetical protein ACXVCS_14825 [Bdellovibrionota bacterium]
MRRAAALAIICLVAPAAFASSGGPDTDALQDKRALEFFQKNAGPASSKYSYNPYESLISGVAAFIFGNVGYLTTTSSSLQITYSAVQTIGIIDIGHGIYQAQAPSMDSSLRDMLSDEKNRNFSREKLAGRLLKIFAQEDRAKRLSIFYSSSFLTVQYAMNATIYKSSGQLKKVYLFLGGVNAIVATYSALSKSKYEAAHYGDKIDISPFANIDPADGATYGLMIGAKF